MYFDQNISSINHQRSLMCVYLERFLFPFFERMFALKKKTPTAKQMEMFLISRNGAFFLLYTDQLIEITVIKRLFGNINIII